jgi:hypothetical protein
MKKRKYLYPRFVEVRFMEQWDICRTAWWSWNGFIDARYYRNSVLKKVESVYERLSDDVRKGMSKEEVVYDYEA